MEAPTGEKSEQKFKQLFEKPLRNYEIQHQGMLLPGGMGGMMQMGAMFPGGVPGMPMMQPRFR